MDKKDRLIQQLTEEVRKLTDENSALKKMVEQLLVRIAELVVRIAELEKRLNKNSRNSSKPPSSDGLSKPPRTTSLREAGKNKSGGQSGHKGETLKQVQTPDKIEQHRVTQCPDCAADLGSEEPSSLIKRQVFDILPPKIEVTEHQAEIKICSCCKKRVAAKFPCSVNAPTQYGEVIQTWAVYLQHQQFIPEDRVQETLQDLLGVKLATATLNRISEEMHNQLTDFEDAVLTKIKTAPVKHLDETGFRIGGNTQWLHVAATESLTYYQASPKRKSLLEGLKNIVIHDHWKPYYQLPEVSHALCNQHHLRELQALIEYEKESWAKKMRRFLRFALRYRHVYGDAPIEEDKLVKLTELYDRIIQQGIIYHESLPCFSIKKGRGRAARRTGHNLVLRLKEYREDTLRFLTTPGVPFTNNQAERDLRMMKCKQKISGGFRSAKGAEIFIRIRGFISTARKQGWNIFESIQQVINGCAPMPA
jgi:transposase